MASWVNYFAVQVHNQREAGRELAARVASICVEALTNHGPGVTIRLGMAIDHVNALCETPEARIFYADRDYDALIENATRLLRQLRAKEARQA